MRGILVRQLDPEGGAAVFSVAIDPDDAPEHANRVGRAVQPEAVAASVEGAGLELWLRRDETDPSLYVYDHDANNYVLLAHYWYEIKGARHLRGSGDFAFGHEADDLRRQHAARDEHREENDCDGDDTPAPRRLARRLLCRCRHSRPPRRGTHRSPSLISGLTGLDPVHN